MQDISQELRRLLKEALLITYQQPVADRRRTVRQQLVKIQAYCKGVEKTFIFRELQITCAQYGIGGDAGHLATLFRGPSEDASVAICVTHQGSLLHRNDGTWRVYDDAGDVNPIEEKTSLELASSDGLSESVDQNSSRAVSSTREIAKRIRAVA